MLLSVNFSEGVEVDKLECKEAAKGGAEEKKHDGKGEKEARLEEESRTLDRGCICIVLICLSGISSNHNPTQVWGTPRVAPLGSLTPQAAGDKRGTGSRRGGITHFPGQLTSDTFLAFSRIP